MIKSLLIPLALGLNPHGRATELEARLYQDMLTEEGVINNPDHSLCYREPIRVEDGHINMAADDYFATTPYPDIFSILVYDQNGKMVKHFMDYSPAGIGIEDEVYDSGSNGLNVRDNRLNQSNISENNQEFIDLLEEAFQSKD